ncbi:acetate/propionate family kinase [Actinomadura flavalba]|uniref:acetate/propionate family kinase n=1 Tax=Actinomadura flavalba TaxID=1120938 RepID=UPI00036D6547|nr:acetate/propionate family kinase [Actinomadura flavalba]
MNVLTVNPGSSSLKLALLDDADAVVATGDTLDALPAPDAIGVRFVHGGDRHRDPVRVDDGVLADLRDVTDLAPLHQPKSLEAVKDAGRAFPGVPVVAVFDTAFHASLPDAAATYPLPAGWRERLGLHRFGFHGLSHAWATRRAGELLRRDPAELRIVSCHLGSGASLAAVAGGRSVDTTMGFTPLEGLVMGTRAGSIDPGIPLWLIRHGVEPDEVRDALERSSGLTALAGTGDLREIRDRTDDDARLALDVYHHRLRACAAAMTAALGGLDVLLFTGGVGEHDDRVRARLCADLAYLGVTLDATANTAVDGDADVSADGAAVRTLVVASREDRGIAAGVRTVLTGEFPGRPGRA